MVTWVMPLPGSNRDGSGSASDWRKRGADPVLTDVSGHVPASLLAKGQSIRSGNLRAETPRRVAVWSCRCIDSQTDGPPQAGNRE
eukprot:3369532-Rhodomonas_salina.1